MGFEDPDQGNCVSGEEIQAFFSWRLHNYWVLAPSPVFYPLPPKGGSIRLLIIGICLNTGATTLNFKL